MATDVEFKLLNIVFIREAKNLKVVLQEGCARKKH